MSYGIFILCLDFCRCSRKVDFSSISFKWIVERDVINSFVARADLNASFALDVKKDSLVCFPISCC